MYIHAILRSCCYKLYSNKKEISLVRCGNIYFNFNSTIPIQDEKFQWYNFVVSWENWCRYEIIVFIEFEEIDNEEIRNKNLRLGLKLSPPPKNYKPFKVMRKLERSFIYEDIRTPTTNTMIKLHKTKLSSHHVTVVNIIKNYKHTNI